jgi:hypothetical protein
MQKMLVWQMSFAQQGWFRSPQSAGRQMVPMQCIPAWQVLFAQQICPWLPHGSHPRAPQMLPGWHALLAQHCWPAAPQVQSPAGSGPPAMHWTSPWQKKLPSAKQHS